VICLQVTLQSFDTLRNLRGSGYQDEGEEGFARQARKVSEVFSAVPGAHEGFAAANHAAGETYCAAGSADHAAHVAAAAAALGPIGASSGYLPAYAPAQANNLAATLLLGHVHHAIGYATSAHKAAAVASDSA
jgi:hypothetical protein